MTKSVLAVPRKTSAKRRAPSGSAQPTYRIVCTGHVQGVGFRPFIYRLAHAHGLSGHVLNCAGQVEIVAQGHETQIQAFIAAIDERHPPLAQPVVAEITRIDSPPLAQFRILQSEADGTPEIHVPPDYFTCDDCLAELDDPSARRYRYPFINCTQCGPRYTIITALPYDRPNTSLAGFPLCRECRAEYGDPLDRRFHAEPLACAACGPRLSLQRGGEIVTGNDAALAETLVALRGGEIVAVKGVGGYHLMCDAENEASVQRLRARKRRPHKPLAVMFPLRGADRLDTARYFLDGEPAAFDRLRSPERPIVLMRWREGAGLAPGIAPGLREVGAFLPYSPLHYLLLKGFGGPLVATSGNVSGEPVITDNREAEARLADVADAFLHHDRPIVRPADDSVVRVIAGRAQPIRIGRGLGPLELDLPRPIHQPTLAVGGHMKNAVAIAWDSRIVVSPHIGELDSPRSLDVFQRVIDDLQKLYQIRAQQIVHDAHPRYASTLWALRQTAFGTVSVLHHHAHASGLAGEHPDVERWLVFTWDGTGYGGDGTLWGGEALLGRPGAWRRVASFRPFRLPGGDKAGREPWRSAAALCWEAGVPFRPETVGQIELAHHAWQRQLNTPTSSAVGRIFDAASCLLGLGERVSFEGQGPMWLEATACAASGAANPLPLELDEEGILRADWAPLLPDLLDPFEDTATRAGLFHARLAETLAAQAAWVREHHGPVTIGLTGGVFQNRLLTELALTALARLGIDARLPQRLPCNDGGLAYGQIIEVLHAAQ